MKDFQQKARGAMLAFACGDALGATTEFMTPDAIRSMYGIHRDITGGGWLELEPGQVTDDTQMTLCVARSLVECDRYDPGNMADKLVDWYNSDPDDIGSACRHGIHMYIRTGQLQRQPGEHQAGNGALMRMLPFIISTSQGVDQEAMVHHAHLTHNDLESDRCIMLYNWIVTASLNGYDKEHLQDLVDMSGLDLEFKGKSGGYVIDSLATVLHCFFTSDTLEDAMIKCANLGGDADTTTAILGGLAGAYYGPDAIPERWSSALDEDVLREVTNLVSRLTGV